jgi:glycosyl-4,4'-diaponeurosporenoate acyltransferase
MMTVYAIAANLPCILAQRYNRLAFERVARIQCQALARP